MKKRISRNKVLVANISLIVKLKAIITSVNLERICIFKTPIKNYLKKYATEIEINIYITENPNFLLGHKYWTPVNNSLIILIAFPKLPLQTNSKLTPQAFSL